MKLIAVLMLIASSTISLVSSNCPHLESPGNGRVSTTGHTFGSLAIYQCYHGFILEPAEFNVRMCLEEGIWSGLTPTCRSPITCSSLSAPSNGNVDITRRTPGGMAIYSCNNGFTLQPSTSRTRACQRNGRWSGVGPICKANRANCGDPGTPFNGRRILGTTLEGDTVRYFCTQGFELVGDQQRVCQSNGQWSGQLPVCRRQIDCGGLLHPVNGRVLLTGTDAGSRATYSCNEGFVLQGLQIRVCHANSQWSGQDPTCNQRVVNCGGLNNPHNGVVQFSSTQQGATATYNCNPDFDLIGNQQRTCEANGQWSGSDPICRRRINNCGQLPNPQNGHVILTGTTAGSLAVYTCRRGFSLVGNIRRSCQNNGQWSESEPICRRNIVSPPTVSPPTVSPPTVSPPLPPGTSCPNPTVPTNGQVQVLITNNRITATYSCNPGFRLTGGSHVRVCQNDKTFSGTAPICVEIDGPFPPVLPVPPGSGTNCPTPASPANGQVVVTQRNNKLVATYSCNSGFHLARGARVRSCQSDDTFSGRAPMCVEDGRQGPPFSPPSPPPTGGTCPHLISPKEGVINVIGFEVGDTATYSCFTGFTLVGPPVRKCTRSGSWSNLEPNCVSDDFVEHLEK